MTWYEEIGGTYRQEGDYVLPNVTFAKTDSEAHIGVWGERHRSYLKQHHRVRYYNLLTAGKLVEYLADVEVQAQGMFEQVVKELAEKEGVTEELKKTDAMIWVQRMNNICNRAKEIVNSEIVLR